ncbi:unnamed protein product, partial [Mesorhabditis belari]|uniref:PRKR-interacting protein 1 n=1 Tax=Mesorhabditis belari TaxID=2138241 RepID=A0AAF3EJ96_9BILA
MPREETKEEEEERKARSAYDLVRLRLKRLEQNIHKPVVIPAMQEKLVAPKPPPEFVRNVVGSSAAAGSAEYHIYRNNRRKEYNRIDYINAKAKLEEEAADFAAKQADVQEEEDDRTAKKRAKRQRLKENKKKKKKPKRESGEDSSDDEESESDEEAKVVKTDAV